ncbi:hypothetical protein DES37_102197 [Mangrovibacter plantisponsor]|uniref:Uncharacterized protein n=1 Tax=Mangrovibacter plantisponsor TaxID=451513 RepID=A0A317Q763_9ENTR|nr:hypothetical protein DES37_102197 [Mangrovibacter plantisponsor]
MRITAFACVAESPQQGACLNITGHLVTWEKKSQLHENGSQNIL